MQDTPLSIYLDSTISTLSPKLTIIVTSNQVTSASDHLNFSSLDTSSNQTSDSSLNLSTLWNYEFPIEITVQQHN